MNKAIDKLKKAWEENPLMVLTIASAAIMSVAKLMDANTSRMNHRVWQKEVDRRIMMKSR